MRGSEKMFQEMVAEDPQPGFAPLASRPVISGVRQRKTTLPSHLLLAPSCAKSTRMLLKQHSCPCLAKTKEIEQNAKIYGEHLKASVGFIGFSYAEQASATRREPNKHRWECDQQLTRAAKAGAESWSPSVNGTEMVGFLALRSSALPTVAAGLVELLWWHW